MRFCRSWFRAPPRFSHDQKPKGSLVGFWSGWSLDHFPRAQLGHYLPLLKPARS